MRVLFASFLPDELLKRPTKALFNRVVFGEHSHAFVSRWNGGGVPSNLVDTEVLRRFWAAPKAHALSFALLQSAWPAEQSAAAPHRAGTTAMRRQVTSSGQPSFIRCNA